MRSKFLYVFPILILLLTWPLFPAWIPALEKFWRWYPFAALLSFIFAKEYFSSTQFKWLICYAIIILANCFSGDRYMYNPIEVCFTLCGLYFITSVPLVILKDENSRVAKFYLTIFTLLFIYTTIASYIFNLEIPDVVRNDLSDTGIEEYRDYFYAYLYRYGLTKYQFAHAIPILVPIFVMIFKNKNNTARTRLFFLFMTILAVVHSSISGSSTVFFLAIFALIMSAMVREGGLANNKKRLIILGVFLAPILFNSVQMFALGIIDMLNGRVGAIHEHIVDLMQSVERSTANGDLQSRSDVYEISYKAFFSSPIWGQNDVVGGHSVFLDHLGAFGIIGFIPFFKFLTSNMQWLRLKLPISSEMYFIISAFTMLFLLAMKNVNLFVLCCFLLVTIPLYIKYCNK